MSGSVLISPLPHHFSALFNCHWLSTMFAISICLVIFLLLGPGGQDVVEEVDMTLFCGQSQHLWEALWLVQ